MVVAFIHPNPSTFDATLRQYFSLPFGLISYITQNPKSADGLKIICGIELFIYAVRAILGANNPTPQNNWQFVGILIGAFITALVFYAIKTIIAPR